MLQAQRTIGSSLVAIAQRVAQLAGAGGSSQDGLFREFLCSQHNTTGCNTKMAITWRIARLAGAGRPRQDGLFSRRLQQQRQLHMYGSQPGALQHQTLSQQLFVTWSDGHNH